MIVLIKKGRNRFGELRRTLPTISQRMLARQLEELVKDGILTRQSFGEVPPRVEYYLTDYGETIYPIIKEMRKWGVSAYGKANIQRYRLNRIISKRLFL